MLPIKEDCQYGVPFFSRGIWTALLFRGLWGIGLAGTFIPGLKALIERLDVGFLPRRSLFTRPVSGWA